MRRMSLAVFALVLAVSAAPAFAQSQDPLIVSSRQFSQQGNHDTAIQMLRAGLASRPNDAALKTELADVLQRKLQSLEQQLKALRSEINTLRGVAAPAAVARNAAGCGSAPSIRVGGDIRQPMKVKDWKPVYPPEAQAARVQGIVIIEAIVGCDGSVSDARVLRGQPMLEQAALEAVRQWRYTPTLLNGQPVPVIMTLTVTFTLQ